MHSRYALRRAQEWGAECSSALFELPHFAVELLIVLPTVQIICSRLRILALPQLRVVVSAGVLFLVRGCVCRLSICLAVCVPDAARIHSHAHGAYHVLPAAHPGAAAALNRGEPKASKI